MNPLTSASAYRSNDYANPLTWVSFYITIGKINFITGDACNTHTYYVRYILLPGGMHPSRIGGSTRMITRLYGGITAFPSSVGIRDIRQNHTFC